MMNLIKLPDIEANLIKFLANSSIYHNWCFQYGCTTCGAKDLRANIIDSAIQKNEHKFHKDIRTTFEFKFINNELMLFKMQDEDKKILIQIICNELKSLTKLDVQQLNPEFLRFLVLEVWVALNKNTKEILRITEGHEIFNFIQQMDRHYKRVRG